VPDHDLLVARYPGVRNVRFRAALELPFLQRCLAALARKLVGGAALPVGAHAYMGLLSLAEFEGEFAAWRIETAVREI